MADSITILGIAGSLRKDSYNKGALRAAQSLCPAGAKLETFDLAGIALMSAAVSVAGGIRAQYQIRQVFVFLNMDAVVQPEVAIGNAPQRFDAAGNLTDETSKKMIGQLLYNLAEKTRMTGKRPLRAAA